VFKGINNSTVPTQNALSVVYVFAINNYYSF